jgi:hypothetical protein
MVAMNNGMSDGEGLGGNGIAGKSPTRSPSGRAIFAA